MLLFRRAIEQAEAASKEVGPFLLWVDQYSEADLQAMAAEREEWRRAAPGRPINVSANFGGGSSRSVYAMKVNNAPFASTRRWGPMLSRRCTAWCARWRSSTGQSTGLSTMRIPALGSEDVGSTPTPSQVHDWLRTLPFSSRRSR